MGDTVFTDSFRSEMKVTRVLRNLSVGDIEASLRTLEIPNGGVV